MQRKSFILAVFVLSFLSSSAHAQEPAYGGTWRTHLSYSLRTCDPVAIIDHASEKVLSQICDGLVDYDENLQLQPELAESWEVSPDGLTYTYHLRRGVRFHDSPVFPGGMGRELTAHDVKFCFDRVLDSRVGSWSYSYFAKRVRGAAEYYEATQRNDAETVAGGVSGFRVVDDYTFAIDLIEPYGPFIHYPALGFCMIYASESVGIPGKNARYMLVGTGPFVLERANENGASLKRNPRYWRSDKEGRQLPYLDGVRFVVTTDGGSVLEAFQEKEMEEHARPSRDQLERILDPSGRLQPEFAGYQLQRIPTLSTQYCGMLTTHDIFQDMRVRQAFSLAIDRRLLLERTGRNQSAVPALHGFTPPGIPGYETEGIEGMGYDPDRARRLLAEAGYPGGEGFPELELSINESPLNVRTAEEIVEMLRKELRIDVEVRSISFAPFIDKIDEGKAAFYRLGWIADYPDPECFLNLLWGENAAEPGMPSTINSTRYGNPQFDSLFGLALATTDDERRFELYRQAEQIAVNDAPMIFLYHDVDHRLLQPYVRGTSTDPMRRNELMNVWFVTGERLEDIR